MISFLVLLLSFAILMAQVMLDKRVTALSPQILFQLYLIIQLPLNLFLGTNYYLPRFDALSPLTPGRDIIEIGSYMLLAQVVFVATIYLFEARPAPQRPPSVPWPRAWANILAAAILGLGYAAFLLLIYINGGYTAFMAERELWRTAGIGGQGWVLFPATTMMAIAMCAIMVNNREKFTGRMGLLRLGLLYGVTILPASQLGFRALVFLPLLQVGYFYHVFVRRIPGPFVLLGSLALMFAFTLFGIQREIPYTSAYGGYLEYLEYVFINRPDLTYTVALRSMGADILQRTIDQMAIFGDYVMLYPSFIEAATIAIPSFLWAGKPVPLSVEFSRSMFGIEGGVSPTIVAEGFWHGNIVGVIALSAIIGLFHGFFRLLQRRSGESASSALLMLALYPSLIMMAESFQGYANGLVLIFVAVWLLRWAITHQSNLSVPRAPGTTRWQDGIGHRDAAPTTFFSPPGATLRRPSRE
jgi:hypothetical protein